MEKRNDFDWYSYWFQKYEPRTPEEIVKFENELKSNLKKDEKWEEDYNQVEWQKEERKYKYCEPKIESLLSETFNELLAGSNLIYESSDEKDKIRNHCYIEFYGRVEDIIIDNAKEMPIVNFQLENYAEMKKFVINILLVIEPRLKLAIPNYQDEAKHKEEIEPVENIDIPEKVLEKRIDDHPEIIVNPSNNKKPFHNGVLKQGFEKHFPNYKKDYSPKKQFEIAYEIASLINNGYELGDEDKLKKFAKSIARYIRTEMSHPKRKKKRNWS